MKRLLLIIWILVILTSLFACHNSRTQTTPTPTIEVTSSPLPTQTPDPIAERLRQMTLQEKVAQLFIIFPEASTTKKQAVIAVSQEMKDFLNQYPVGGMIFFESNVQNPEQLRALTRDLQASSKYPLLIAIDEEGGRVARIGKNPNFSVPRITSALEIGQQNTPFLAKEWGQQLGTYLKEYGINYNLAPVADILSNPANMVIGDRSFGSDPQMVAQMVTKMMKGLQEKAIVTCVKHFPGHGDTSKDTHVGSVISEKTWEEMLSCELVPFKAAIAQRADSIMVGHISTPNVTSDGLPNSLSYEMITTRLREELGFQGVVITDALNMGAITQNYSAGDAAQKAFLAGADILLMPQNFTEAYHAILQSVETGTISEARLNESVLRILKLKEAACVTSSW